MTIKSIKTGWTGVSANAGGYFNPGNLPSLLLWLDGSNDNSFTYSSGTRVSQWNDLSGNGYHFTQATTANQPDRNVTQSGRSAVTMRTSTATYFMQNTTLEWAIRPYTILSVVRFNIGSSAALISDNQYYWVGVNSSSPANLAIGLAYDATISTTNLTQANTTTSQITYKSAGLTLFDQTMTVQTYQNKTASSGTAYLGSVPYPAGVATIGASTSGTRNQFGTNGYICEIIIYERQLPDNEREAVENYLMTKWVI